MKKAICWILIVVLSCVFLYSAYSLGDYMLNSYKNKNFYGELQEQMNQNRPPRREPTEPVADTTKPEETTPETLPEPPRPVIVTNPKTGEEMEILPEFEALFQRNPDVVGWIEIPDTPIYYPVMQSEEPNFYLKRNYDKKWDAWGSIYAKEDCDIFAPSDNTIIYGHHFLDNTMFSRLIEYKKKSFYEDHRYIYFDTLTERKIYEVIAAFQTTATLGEGFRYHTYVNFRDEAEFDEYVNTCKRLCPYSIEATASYGDELITLSTCDLTFTNGRFVVVGRRIS